MTLPPVVSAVCTRVSCRIIHLLSTKPKYYNKVNINYDVVSINNSEIKVPY